MANTLKQVADFIIKTVMMFTTIIVLIFFAEKYSENALVFGFFALLYILAIITKGLIDIFQKK